MRFEGQTVVTTGASRGIGAEIARRFAAEGAKVACVASRKENAEAIAAEIGGQAFGADLGDVAAATALFGEIESAMGTPHVLVNNAGLTRDGLLLRMKEDDWDRVLDVNLKGAFVATQAVLKGMMKARYGRIVNITSIVGLHGAAGQANYAASKAGLVGFTMSVAKEVGSRGITCNAVAPGFIRTDMTDGLPDEFKAHVEKTAPAGRLGEAEDVAHAVLFLASREASYVTGQTLTVDGGLTL